LKVSIKKIAVARWGTGPIIRPIDFLESLIRQIIPKKGPEDVTINVDIILLNGTPNRHQADKI
jgi:hypothetical protein